jgi:putative transposase
MKVLKGKSAEYLRGDVPELKKRHCGLPLWARGYFVSTVGIDREEIHTYVKDQQESQIREVQLRLWKDSIE